MKNDYKFICARLSVVRDLIIFDTSDYSLPAYGGYKTKRLIYCKLELPTRLFNKLEKYKSNICLNILNFKKLIQDKIIDEIKKIKIKYMI